jgi:hypothetical protein
MPSRMLDLHPQGKTLMLRATNDKTWVQFTILGPRLGVKAVDFVTPRRLREIGRELMRLANEIEGKTNLRVVRG